MEILQIVNMKNSVSGTIPDMKRIHHTRASNRVAEKTSDRIRLYLNKQLGNDYLQKNLYRG